MHHFRTRHHEFDGFSDYYEREVRPFLIERDDTRRSSVRTGLGIGVVSVILAAVIAGYVFWKYDNPAIALFLVALGPMGALGAFAYFTHSIRMEVKEKIVGAIVGYVGWSFVSDVPDYDMSDFARLFLLPTRYDRVSFEDRLSGEAHGAAFHSVEAHMEKRERDGDGSDTWRTVFRGQLMVLDFPTKTFGRTVVLRDKRRLNKRKKGDMKRIGLADPVFENAFEAYGTDQVEGRVILDPAFMQRIVDLEQAVSGKNIQFGFNNDQLLISVETGNQFEIGTLFKSLDTPDRAQKILDEVAALFDVVDTLLK